VKTAAKISGFSTMSHVAADAKNYHEWVLKSYEKFISGNILEIGTGKSYYKKNIRSEGVFVSVDNDPEVIAAAKSADADGKYLLADISGDDCLEMLKNNNFQTIMCFNVLEHIENDQKAFDNMFAKLEEGRHLLIFVPAFPCLFNRKDLLAGHIRRYRKKSIRNFTNKHPEAEFIKLQYFNPIGAIGYWFNKFARHRTLNNKSIRVQARFFDKYLVSLSKAANPLFKNFFGLSLLCVIQKKSSK
jgi:SAM-dependent methyltransferase